MEKLKALWGRLRVHWHVVAVAFITALPSILDYLGVIDLKPILMDLGVKEALAGLIVKVLPFVLAFIKPMLVVEPAEKE